MSAKWSKEEIAILEQKADLYTKEQIARMLKRRGYHRSTMAIKLKLNRLGYSTRPTLDNYSCKEIAKVLRLSFSTICRWVRLGWLKASKRSASCYQVRTWHLKQFLENPPQPIKERIESLDPEAINYLVGNKV
ncbi:hypothetical protein H6G76_29740 [Nostoc sp. FACHB-152]|uniref:hypothetical protein n=1 Tax=Nostoc sp. FACHB-152 TaxID=2692837 RepID=UPI001689C60D|nr:hypothetical protein [Nostoc sp. FACHB-152]MBD2451240.1 hypothetical protein [Nostoc sp. FACHB-152]